VGYLTALVAVGACGAFDVPPVANVLRALPVLDVMDHRRLTLWIAFGLVFLGGIGLDGLTVPSRAWRACWVGGAALLVLAALAVGRAGPRLESHALAHYRQAAASTPGADPALYRERALRQASRTLSFVPRYALKAAAHLAFLAALAEVLRRGRTRPGAARTVLVGVVLADLFAFGFGLNPAIHRGDDRPEPELIAYLRREAPPPARILALGAELPPNTAMRYGLADVRNYDSIESARNLAFFAPLYEPGPSRTSRRAITWQGVARAIIRLRDADVAAVIGPTPPPGGLFDRVDRVGSVWVGRLDGRPRAAMSSVNGLVHVRLAQRALNEPRIAITYDPGWRATIDDRPAAVRPDATGAFLSVAIPAGARRLTLRYDPPEVRASLVLSLLSLIVLGALVARRPDASCRRKTASGAWKPRTHRVRIEPEISDRSPSPVSH
jgi:hypothetical protein